MAYSLLEKLGDCFADTEAGFEGWISLSGEDYTASLSVMKSGKESTGVVGRVTFEPENRIMSLGEEPCGAYTYKRLASD